jgi:type VII secretion integral membrane protein EccD
MATGLSRVTIVAPRSRVDIALPTDVTLAEVLPTLLDLSGGAGDESGRRDGWSLHRLGGTDLDSSRTLAQLEVRDGELLYLRPRGYSAPATVFDDLVDALATGTRDRGGRWTATTSRRAGFIAGVLALFGGAIALLFTGPPYQAAGLTAAGLAPALIAVAVVFARALGDARIGTAYAMVATAYAGVGGLLVAAGDRPLADLSVAHVTIAASAAIVAAAVLAVGVPAAAPVFLAVGVCCVAGLGTMGLATALEGGVGAGAAVVAVVAYAGLPALPMLAYRLAGLPRPTVPTQREHLRQETETFDGAKVLDSSRRVEAYLAALLAALAIISAGTAVLISTAGGPGIAMAGVLGLLPILRSRWFGGRAQRLPLVISGGIGLASCGVAVYLLAGPQHRLLWVGGLAVVIALSSVVLGLTGDRPQAPPWGRFLDIVESLLILALAPLAVWVSGVLDVVRAIRG